MKFKIQDFKFFSRKLQKIHDLILFLDGDASLFFNTFPLPLSAQSGCSEEIIG